MVVQNRVKKGTFNPHKHALIDGNKTNGLLSVLVPVRHTYKGISWLFVVTTTDETHTSSIQTTDPKNA